MPVPGTHVNPGLRTAVTARALNSPGSTNDDLFVTIPSYGAMRSHVLGWVPKEPLPVDGDECLVVYDEHGNPWVTAWLAGSGYKGNNVKRYGAKGDNSVDDSVAIQACIDANVGGTVYLPTGTYRLDKALVLPTATDLEGQHMYGTVLLATGDFYCISLGRVGVDAAAIKITNLKLEAATKQSAGGGIGWNAVSAEIHIDHVCLGNCLYRGIDISGHAIGGVFLDHIRWNGVVTAVRECTTGIRVGDSANLVVGVYGHDVTGAANTHGDMPTWLELNYCDTVQFTDCLFQTGTVGVSTQPLGHPPATTFRAVTGLKLRNVVCDDFSGNGYILKQVRDCELVNCNAQGCFFGILVAEQSVGVRIHGGCMQINKYHGIVLEDGEHISILGVDIADNGSAINAGIAGVSVAPNVSHWSVKDCRIGNYYGLLENVTHFGVAVEEGASDYYVIEGNEFIGPAATHPLTADVYEVGVTGTHKRVADNIVF